MDKKTKLKNIRKSIDKTTDKLNKKIDKGIKETIVFLNALDINTTGSCEGHLKWGWCGPWVDIGTKETKEFLSLSKKLSDLRKLIREEESKDKPSKKVLDKLDNQHYKLRKVEDRHNMKEYKKLFNLLKDFYKDRRVEIDRMLVLNTMFGRLQCQGSEINTFESRNIKKINLKKYQDEMNVFTGFLKEKFFQK